MLFELGPEGRVRFQQSEASIEGRPGDDRGSSKGVRAGIVGDVRGRATESLKCSSPFVEAEDARSRARQVRAFIDFSKRHNMGYQ